MNGVDIQSLLASALQSRRAGDAAAAERDLRAVLAVQPAHVGANHMLGVMALEHGANNEAIALFDRALFGAPDLAPLHYNRGNAFSAAGRLRDAAAAYRRAIELDPELGEAQFNLGNVLRAQGEPDAALAAYTDAARSRPALVEAWQRIGILHSELGRWDAATTAFDRALAIDPGHVQAWNRRGIALHSLHRVDEALASYEKALALDSARPELWNNLGNALHDLRRSDAARDAYLRAVALDPSSAEAVSNLGMIAQEAGDLGRARDNYARAQSLRPENASALRRQATLNLLQGRFAEGWEDFERSQEWGLRTMPKPDIPWWRGEDLRGKSILLSEPNGLGDTIQFFRFVPQLVAAGARVSFLGPASLFKLLSPLAEGVQFTTDRTDGRHDVQALLWSLPHYLRIASESQMGMAAPYLRADPARLERWRHLLDPSAINIGIGWQGNPARKIDRGRSIPLASFLPVAQVPGVRLVSLQKHHGLDQLAQLPEGMRVVDPGPDFDAGPDAFGDSAALMQGLDLVLASDSSLVHVAGALGRPAWTALPLVPEWRWMLKRDDSPWYPSLRLLRQRRLDDWAPVFTQMAEALRDFKPGRRA